MADSREDQQQQEVMKKCIHKTKTIQCLGRTTPIVLQNDNGPCSLLAICNVLLLRNNLNLSPDIGEVSKLKLLSLVAERLNDSNSNVNVITLAIPVDFAGKIALDHAHDYNRFTKALDHKS